MRGAGPTTPVTPQQESWAWGPTTPSPRQTQLHITSQPSALESLFKVGGAASYSDAGCMPFCTRAPAKELARKRPMSTTGWVGGRKMLGSRALFSSMPLRQTAASSAALLQTCPSMSLPPAQFAVSCLPVLTLFASGKLNCTSLPNPPPLTHFSKSVVQLHILMLDACRSAQERQQRS